MTYCINFCINRAENKWYGYFFSFLLQFLSTQTNLQLMYIEISLIEHLIITLIKVQTLSSYSSIYSYKYLITRYFSCWQKYFLWCIRHPHLSISSSSMLNKKKKSCGTLGIHSRKFPRTSNFSTEWSLHHERTKDARVKTGIWCI